MEAYIQKKTWTGIFTAALIVAKNETNQISTNKRMQKQVVIYVYNDNFKRQISDVLHEWISKTLCQKKESRHRRENKKLRYGYGNQSFPKSGSGRGESQGSPGKRDYDACICFTWEILEFREARDMRYADIHICQTHWPVHLESVHFTVCKLESEKYF